jgi:hypothetical protein
LPIFLASSSTNFLLFIRISFLSRMKDPLLARRSSILAALLGLGLGDENSVSTRPSTSSGDSVTPLILARSVMTSRSACTRRERSSDSSFLSFSMAATVAGPGELGASPDVLRFSFNGEAGLEPPLEEREWWGGGGGSATVAAAASRSFCSCSHLRCHMSDSSPVSFSCCVFCRSFCCTFSMLFRASISCFRVSFSAASLLTWV